MVQSMVITNIRDMMHPCFATSNLYVVFPMCRTRHSLVCRCGFVSNMNVSNRDVIRIYFRRRRHKCKSLVKTPSMEGEKTTKKTLSSALGSQRLTADELAMSVSVNSVSNLLPASTSSSWTMQPIAIYVTQTRKLDGV